MRVTRNTTVTKDITRCFHQCPYFKVDGHDMECEHPDAPDKGMIITYPECYNGFPPRCPLINTRPT